MVGGLFQITDDGRQTYNGGQEEGGKGRLERRARRAGKGGTRGRGCRGQAGRFGARVRVRLDSE